MLTAQVIVADDCSCAPGVAYADGTMPTYLEDAGAAARLWVKHKADDHARGRYTFWGVHVGGRHILNVLSAGPRS